MPRQVGTADPRTRNAGSVDAELTIGLVKLPREVRRDGRWPLWRELRDRRAELLGERRDEPPWTALRFSWQPQADTIAFAFDRRLPGKTVREALERELPHLRAAGWLCTSQPLSKRELALLRYVCLESALEAGWRERAKGWRHSLSCKAHPKWGKPYRGKHAAQRFTRDFHKAEKHLAGRKGALRVYYDPRVRERDARLARRKAESAAAPTRDAAAQQQEIIAWQRVDPAKAAALRARFAVTAQIDELVAKALAGDAAAADEAVSLCLRFRPAAIDELRTRLSRVREDDPRDPNQSGQVD